MNEEMEMRETTVDGSQTRRWVVEAGECAALVVQRVARLGIDEAVAPYRRVRMSPAGSFVLACVKGQGRVLLEGKWQRVKAGMVCLAPPRVPNAFYAEGKEPWVFAWVRYEEPVFLSPMVGAASPVLPVAEGRALVRVMEGFREEWEGQRDAAMVHHWLELMQGLVRRWSRPWWRGEPRVAALWAAVQEDLKRDWTLEELAHRCHCSAEHLRRLCMKELGRSPMQHLTSLRMDLARRLLATTEDKLEVIAGEVGYANAAVFCRVFKRWVGVVPGEWRGGGSRE
jgi:AraC-like DNA-binding protein/mannose-6-phosphate isomerase-like protein (cupin superfamily)